MTCTSYDNLRITMTAISWLTIFWYISSLDRSSPEKNKCLWLVIDWEFWEGKYQYVALIINTMILTLVRLYGSLVYQQQQICQRNVNEHIQILKRKWSTSFIEFYKSALRNIVSSKTFSVKQIKNFYYGNQ